MPAPSRPPARSPARAALRRAAPGLAAALIGALAVFAFLAGRAAPDLPVSDHFDGARFTNPAGAAQASPGLSDVFAMLREGRAAWPERLASPGRPRLDADLGAQGLALTFVGHATFLAQLPGATLLIDPVWSERASPVQWAGPRRVRPPGVAFDALPRIDVVLISHNHYDHLDLATLRRLEARFSPAFVVPLGLAPLLASAGITRVTELDWWQGYDAPSGTRIVFAPAQHGSGRGLFDRNSTLWGSYYIRRGARSLYYGADSGYAALFGEIRARLGAPEIALLGIGAYEPRWFMKPLHMNPAEAVRAHGDLGAGLSIGMHHGTFQLSSEAIDAPQAALAEALRAAGVAPDRFITLPEGDTWLVAATPR